MEFCFRKCEEADYDFILELKEKCFRWYVEKLYGWDIEAQRMYLKHEMEQGITAMNVIQAEGEDIGIFTYYIDNSGDGCIEMFAILPEYQEKGIGTEIIKSKLSENKEKGIRTYLKTYKENPARFLYQKNGFVVYDSTETHLLMEVKIHTDKENKQPYFNTLIT